MPFTLPPLPYAPDAIELQALRTIEFDHVWFRYPGKSHDVLQDITFQLDPRTLSQVDEKGIRAVSAGNYKLSLGSSQPDGDRRRIDIHRQVTFRSGNPHQNLPLTAQYEDRARR